MSHRMALVIALVAFLSAVESRTIVKRSESDGNGIRSSLALHPLVRANSWIPGGPCGREDFKCMNAKALEYTNSIRAQAGRYPLEMGTEYMLNNAMFHSKVQQQRGTIFHQDLGTTPLGCGSSFSGENVAQNFVWAVPNAASDPAKICVYQLRDSPPHYKNIISDYSKASVTGIFIDSKNWIWCTQTFAVGIQYGSGNCAMCPLHGVAPQNGGHGQPPPEQHTQENIQEPVIGPEQIMPSQPDQETQPNENHGEDPHAPWNKEPAPESTENHEAGFHAQNPDNFAPGHSPTEDYFDSEHQPPQELRGDTRNEYPPQEQPEEELGVDSRDHFTPKAPSEEDLDALNIDETEPLPEALKPIEPVEYPGPPGKRRDEMQKMKVATTDKNGKTVVSRGRPDFASFWSAFDWGDKLGLTQEKPSKKKKVKGKWRESGRVMWKTKCKFYGKKLSQARTPPGRCSALCERTRKCTHFMFRSRQCVLMSNQKVQKGQAVYSGAQGARCGILRRPKKAKRRRRRKRTKKSKKPRKSKKPKKSKKNFKWKTSNEAIWASGCTFRGKTMAKRRLKEKKCAHACSRHFGCTHFSYNGKFCFFRRAKDIRKSLAKKKPGSMCGILKAALKN